MARQEPPESTQVKTFLHGYRKDDGKRPFAFIREQTSDEIATYKARVGPPSSPVETTILNGRGMNLSLDKNAFELICHPTMLKTKDFYLDKEKVTSVYYKEVAEAIRQATGAQFSYIFHHQVRNAGNASGTPGSKAAVQSYAGAIHTDSHPQQSDSFFHSILPAAKAQAAASGLDLDLSKGRFLYLNAWRNISSDPILRDPLAVCDESSLCRPDDYISADLFAQAYTLQQYRLNARNASRHRWYYFPRMTKDEILLFKQWDSDPTLSGRCCFHTAFEDPTAPSDAPSRESIEVRAMCYFPDHEPNTCPEVAKAADTVDNAARRLTDAVRRLQHWPSAAKSMAVALSMWPGGATILAKRLIKDEKGYFGLGSMSDVERAETVSRLMTPRNQGGMGFEEEFKKIVWQVCWSQRIETVVVSLASAGIGWGLSYWSYHRVWTGSS